MGSRHSHWTGWARRPWAPQDLGAAVIYWTRGDYATSSPVDSWRDLGPVNNSPTAAGLLRPTTSSVDGCPVVRFDGVLNRLTFPTNITADVCTLFAVVARISGSGDHALISLSNPAIYMTLGGTEWGVYANGNVLSGQSLDTAPHILTVVVRAANDIDLYTDGGNKVTRTNGAGFPGRATSAVGADASGVQASNMDLFELGIVAGAMGTTDILRLHQYFSGRYSIALQA